MHSGSPFSCGVCNNEPAYVYADPSSNLMHPDPTFHSRVAGWTSPLVTLLSTSTHHSDSSRTMSRRCLGHSRSSLATTRPLLQTLVLDRCMAHHLGAPLHRRRRLLLLLGRVALMVAFLSLALEDCFESCLNRRSTGHNHSSVPTEIQVRRMSAAHTAHAP
jgi:hypothetical protein